MVEARHHFEQGVALYNDGNYAAALAEFDASYRLFPTPGVLYNIGLTHKSLFRYAEAIDALRQYLNEAKNITGKRRFEVEQVIAETNALLADLTLTVQPDGAAVTIDGRAAGTAPLKTLRVAAGHHNIEVMAEGHRSLRREIMVDAGVPLALTLSLVALPRSGKVHFTASQPRSLIRVDNNALGLAPLDAELSSGGHALLVSAPGYATYHSELVITAGQSRAVGVILDPLPKFYKKWWFWTLMGVAAGGIAAAIAVPLVAGGSLEAPLPGTLAPGTGRAN